MQTQQDGTNYVTQTLESIRAEALHQKYLRESPSEISNALRQREIVCSTLEEVRKLDDPRAAPLLKYLMDLDARGAVAFDKFEKFGQILDDAEKRARAAHRARDDAKAAHARGSTDADEALRLFTTLEIAESAARATDFEYEQAKRPARLPKDVGLPMEARDPLTANLVRLFESNPVDFNLATIHHFPTDVVRIASDQGRAAEPKEAIWWPLSESRALASLKKKTDASDREELRQLFAVRWAEYVRIQGMSELERERARGRIR